MNYIDRIQQMRDRERGISDPVAYRGRRGYYPIPKSKTTKKNDLDPVSSQHLNVSSKYKGAINKNW